MRAFVFSLDAFVAFILALVAVYSLIFFSSVPSAYYYLLTQAHYLSRDALMAVSTTGCDAVAMATCSGSALDYILSDELAGREALREQAISDTIGKIVPDQFGYALEVSSDNGATWSTYYDTRTYDTRTEDDGHAMEIKKLKVATEVVNFGYAGLVQKADESPYKYLTCSGEGLGAGGDGVIITCGDYNLNNPAAGAGAGAGDEGVVPSPEAKIARLVVFI